MKKALLILTAATLIFSCKKKDEVVPEAPKAPQIEGYFKMDGDVSDSTRTIDAAATDVVFGPKTALFNGTSSFIRIPANGTLTVPDRLSLSLFFKANYPDPTKTPRLLQLNDATGNAIEIYIQNSRVVLSNWNQAQDKELVRIMTPSSPDMRTWHKVVATIDFAGNTMSLYVDDQLVRTVNNVTLSRPQDGTLILGYHQHPGDQPHDFYSGEMDNFRIHPGILEHSAFSTIAR